MGALPWKAVHPEVVRGNTEAVAVDGLAAVAVAGPAVAAAVNGLEAVDGLAASGLAVDGRTSVGASSLHLRTDMS